MPRSSPRLFLFLSGLLIIIVPLIVSLIYHGGLPPGFGVFPPEQGPPKPGFSLPIFIFGVLVGLIITAVYVFPQWFGFKPAAEAEPFGPFGRKARPEAGFPVWFWPGVAIMIVFWAIMWLQPGGIGFIVHLTFVPMWWGFILALDGLVYRRTGGISLIARSPGTMALVALSSCIGWFLFEYIDYFVLSNWYYPIRDVFSTFGYLVWFGLAYTTVIPSVFEWYTLLNTSDFMRKRYANGPRITLSMRSWWLVYLAGILLMAGLTYWPNALFYAVWLGPLLILTAALMLAGYWTPFVPIARGNWSLIGLMSLACVVNYFIGEMWNFWSPPANPNFWKYDVPYVSVFHIFEMPILGFFGYLPFGILCWIWWLWSTHLLGLNPDVTLGAVKYKGQPWK